MTGYSIVESVFDAREMIEASGALAAASLPRTKAGIRHVLRLPAIRALAARPELLSLAANVLGSDPVPFRATLFDKSASANWLVTWHQDIALPLARRVDDPTWGPWSIKGGVLHAIAPASALEQVVALRIHLDDSTDTNGPLRVLPGPHQRGILSDEQIQHIVNSIAPVSCTARAGSVVAMRPLLVHASSKAIDTNPRRVLHVEYAASVELAPEIGLAID
jgi:ectoine hydroxylase-related dioxygenase (phytanoyl-CoA dioxygenase family)